LNTALKKGIIKKELPDQQFLKIISKREES